MGRGGGVVTEFFFSVASKSRRDSEWGGGRTRNFPLMGPFYIFGFPEGGPRPPPLNRPLYPSFVRFSGPTQVLCDKRHIPTSCIDSPVYFQGMTKRSAGRHVGRSFSPSLYPLRKKIPESSQCNKSNDDKDHNNTYIMHVMKYIFFYNWHNLYNFFYHFTIVIKCCRGLALSFFSALCSFPIISQ